MAEPLLSNLTVQVIVAVTSALVTIGLPIIFAKLNKISTLYTTIFGVSESSSMEGLVGVVEQHEDDIEELENNQRELDNRVQTLEQKCKNRRADKE